MRNWLITTLLFLPLYSLAGAKQPTQAETDSTWLVTHYTKQEVYITMRDGIRLFTIIYAPVDIPITVSKPDKRGISILTQPEKHPILMMRTPYSVSPYGADTFRAFWKTHYMQYLKRGYVMVLQDVRGKFMSEGDFVNIRPFNPDKKTNNDIDEASDAYDTIDWLVKNVSNNNGRVGVYGISYPGFYATMAALSGSPYLKAVSPQAPVTDWFSGDDVHHNGAFFLMDNFGFGSSFDRPRTGPTKSFPKGYDFPIKDNYKFYLGVGTIDSLGKLMGDARPYWDELCAHPDYDDYWKARDPRQYIKYIPDDCATLVVGGLFDAEDCYGAWNLYKAIEKNAHNDNKLVIGPWAHGFWAKDSGAFLGNVRFDSNTSYAYQQQFEIPFFDEHLLPGKYPMEAYKHSEAFVFITGRDIFMHYNKWPSGNTKNTKIFLQNNDILNFEKSTETNTLDYYISDPAHPVPYTEDVHFGRTREYMTDDQRFASRRPDVLTYQTDELKDDITVAGVPAANLFVSLSTTDADFIVKIIDVFPDDFKYPDSVKGNGKNYPMGGYQMLVRGEVMRGRYRNSLSKPEPFEPGEITEVKYNLPDICHVFKKGHRIMVQIQSTWFPLVDRNPQQYINIYHAKPEDFIKTKVKIYHGKEHPSHISLPVL